MLNLRNQYNIPIWCGESGENSNVWFTDAIKLMEQNNIGWAWWPLKKVESISGPLSIVKPAGYQKLLDYWSGKSGKPTVEYANEALQQLAANARFENCVIQRDVIDAMIRQVQSNETVPFVKNVIPGKVKAVNFDLGRLDYAYHDTEVADYHVSSGTWTGWNNGWAYRNDGVDIEPCADPDGPEYNIGWIEKDEWLKYTILVNKTDYYNLAFRVASANSAGLIRLLVDEKPHSADLTIKSTGGWQTWKTTTMEDVYLSKGEHALKLDFLSGGFNMSEIEFIATGTVQNEQLPVSLTLMQNFPNPFNAGTKMPFVLSESSRVIISIYDVKGSLVRELPEEEFPAGEHSIDWDGKRDDGRSIGSGIYFYQCQAGDAISVRSMLYLR